MSLETVPPTARLPFRLDIAASPGALVDQVAAGLRGAIQSGTWAAGARLPGLREVAAELGVSYVVVHKAVRRLADDGLLIAQRKTGVRVASTNERIWRGHVLWVTHSAQPFYFAARQETMLRHLELANLRVSTASVPPIDEADPLPFVRTALATASVSLVASDGIYPGLADECARVGVPLVTCDSTATHGVAGRLIANHRQALTDCARHCLALGLVRPAVFATISRLAAEAVEIFAEHGLRLDVVPQGRSWHGDSPVEQHENAGYDSMVSLLASGRLPQVLYITDDYAMRGCLMALALAGCRVPDDLQIITWSNRRHLPAYPLAFTRIEMDPEASGARFAELIVNVLARQDDTPVEVHDDARFIPGATTRPRLPSPPPTQE